MEKINRSIINRSTLMKMHALLAAFILPVAIMFVVTGALYTWGIKGGYETTTYEIQLEKPIQGELTELLALAKDELNKQNIAPPSGQASIKKMGSSLLLEWTGSKIDVVVEPTFQPLVATLEIKNTSWHRQFVQLHKAKGGTPFKVYAAAFAIALLLLLVSGFIMAWLTPKLRKLTIASAILGVVLFIAMVITS